MSISHTSLTANCLRSYGNSDCGECGRKPWEHCRAMGSQVGIDEDCYLACVYCSTYRAVEDFLKSDTKWFDMLQLSGQVRFCFSVCVDTCTRACIQLCTS